MTSEQLKKAKELESKINWLKRFGPVTKNALSSDEFWTTQVISNFVNIDEYNANVEKAISELEKQLDEL